MLGTVSRFSDSLVAAQRYVKLCAECPLKLTLEKNIINKGRASFLLDHPEGLSESSYNYEHWHFKTCYNRLTLSETGYFYRHQIRFDPQKKHINLVKK